MYLLDQLELTNTLCGFSRTPPAWVQPGLFWAGFPGQLRLRVPSFHSASQAPGATPRITRLGLEALRIQTLCRSRL